MKITVNNISLFYKKSGKGPPIVLLHGNSETHHIFDNLVPKLSKKYTVYAIDSRCHGESQKTKELGYEDMAKDVAEFIKELGLSKVTLYGFSDGGIVSILVAIQHPGLISKLVVSGANLNPKGLGLWFKISIWASFLFSPSEAVKMMLTQPNIKTDDLKKISVPTIVTAGQFDIIKRKHTVEIAKNIKNSQLVILKKENHISYVVNSDKLLKYLL